MLVKDFMHPKAEVVTVAPLSSIKDLLDQVVEKSLRAVVVVGTDNRPVGVVTKADLIKAYQLGLDPKEHNVNEIMSTRIENVFDTSSKEAAAKHFQDTKHENAFVLNKEKEWVGMLNAIDIAVECVRDTKAWPWNREALSRFAKVPHTPGNQPVVAHTFEQISGAGEFRA